MHTQDTGGSVCGTYQNRQVQCLHRGLLGSVRARTGCTSVGGMYFGKCSCRWWHRPVTPAWKGLGNAPRAPTVPVAALFWRSRRAACLHQPTDDSLFRAKKEWAANQPVVQLRSSRSDDSTGAPSSKQSNHRSFFIVACLRQSRPTRRRPTTHPSFPILPAGETSYLSHHHREITTRGPPLFASNFGLP